MTPAEVREALESSVTQPFLVALEVLSIGETAGRAAYRRGELPFRVIRMGRVLRVPSADLWPLLEPAGAPSSVGAL